MTAELPSAPICQLMFIIRSCSRECPNADVTARGVDAHVCSRHAHTDVSRKRNGYDGVTRWCDDDADATLCKGTTNAFVGPRGAHVGKLRGIYTAGGAGTYEWIDDAVRHALYADYERMAGSILRSAAGDYLY